MLIDKLSVILSYCHLGLHLGMRNKQHCYVLHNRINTFSDSYTMQTA